MHEELIIAGFGGQGIMLMGKLLAEACMEEGRHVSWLPSYGPEMRGGTANCHVIVSDEPVASPIIVSATLLVAMNGPSLDKFAAGLSGGGKLFVNSSIIDAKVARDDVSVHEVRANHIADSLGNLKTANMVMAGAVLKATALASLETMEGVIRESLAGRKASMIDVNIRALREGFQAAG
jgi:2-oxoglutarate ferredoxin oxidoreductase subunit gamma